MEKRSEIKELAYKYSDLEHTLINFSSSDVNIDLSESDKKIIFSEDIVNAMIDAQNDTLMFGNSNGFFIYGKEVSPGIIVFFKTTKHNFETVLKFSDVSERMKINFNIEIRNIKDIEKLHNQKIIDVLNMEDLIDISAMGSSSIYEMLLDGLYRELPNGEKSVDSIIHFHTHNNISEYSTDYSVKDLLIYSYLFPSLIDSLDSIDERTDIKFYGTLMCPERLNKTNGLIRLSTVESMKMNSTEDLDFEFNMIPMYKLSNDGSRLELINSKSFYKYTTYPDNFINTISNGTYLTDVSNTKDGIECLNKIKQYVKKTR